VILQACDIDVLLDKKISVGGPAGYNIAVKLTVYILFES